VLGELEGVTGETAPDDVVTGGRVGVLEPTNSYLI